MYTWCLVQKGRGAKQELYAARGHKFQATRRTNNAHTHTIFCSLKCSPRRTMQHMNSLSASAVLRSVENGCALSAVRARPLLCDVVSQISHTHIHSTMSAIIRPNNLLSPSKCISLVVAERGFITFITICFSDHCRQ
jgi:hypothetical protein